MVAEVLCLDADAQILGSAVVSGACRDGKMHVRGPVVVPIEMGGTVDRVVAYLPIIGMSGSVRMHERPGDVLAGDTVTCEFDDGVLCRFTAED
jgi:hypothetical protein